MLYTNGDYINRYFGNLAGGRYDLWYASWPEVVDVTKPPRQCGIWQWGSSEIPGIHGNVDTNESYKDYPTLLRQNGSNHLPPLETIQEPVVENPVDDTQTNTSKPISQSEKIIYIKYQFSQKIVYLRGLLSTIVVIL